MRSGWMRMVRMAVAMLALAVGVWAQGAGAQEAIITNVTAEYAWPWGVGIRFDLTKAENDQGYSYVRATDWENGNNYSCRIYSHLTTLVWREDKWQTMETQGGGRSRRGST